MRAKSIQSISLKLFAGVDLHNESFNVHIIDENERRCDSRKVTTSEEAIREYFTPFIGLDMEVAVEIGNPTFWYCDILEEMGFKYRIVHTLDYSRTSNNKKKSDKQDAKHLCFDLKRNNLPPTPVYKPKLIQRELRSLLTHRHQYVKDKVRTANRTYAFLSGRGIKVKKKTLGNSLRYWESLFARLQEEGRWDSVLVELRLYHQDFKRLITQIKDIKDRIVKLIKAHYQTTYNRLLTLPGIGFVIAANLIAQVGDWSRFKSGKKLVAYFGLTPAHRNSANKPLKGDGRITKEGSSRIRSYLIQAGLSLIRSISKNAIPLRRWYENLKIRKGWKKARVALVRKMCEILFAMIRNGTDYDPALLEKNSKPAL